MGLNYFIGWSRQDLERELRRAQEDMAAGASIESAGSGDVNSRNRTEHSPSERIKLLLKALSALDPEAYPASSTVAIRQTRIQFAQGTKWQNEPTE
jgi:hypothetical protein